MSELTDKLQSMGCDMDGALNRFLQDENFYLDCYKQVLDDEAFGKLKEALENKQTEEAFHYAHTLKGVIANMGLTPLYNIVVRIVEPLRAGSIENLMPIYEELMTEREKYKALL